MGDAGDRSVLSRPAAPPDDVLAYADHREAIADIRYAADGERHPLVVFVHGGFWRPEYDRVNAGSGPVCADLAAAGWTTAAIEYRRVPGAPDATVDDVRTAVERLPALVGSQDGRALLVGHSAGGHLVLWAATAAGSDLAGVVALAAVADLELADALDLGGGAVRAFLGDAAQARPDLDPARLPAPPCPVSLVHGAEDTTVPPEVARAYARANPDARLLEVPATGHFGVIDPLAPAWRVVGEEVSRLSAPGPG